MTTPHIEAEPFTNTFDFNDDHCSSSVECVLAELPEVARPLLDNIDDTDAAHTILLRRATELDEEDPSSSSNPNDTLADTLRAASAWLTYCGGWCSCALDAWEGWARDNVQYDLDSLGLHVWSVRTPDGTSEEDIVDALDVKDILSNLTGRDGWSSLNVTWDRTKLTISLDGRHCSAPALEMTPLTKVQRDLATRWAGFDDYNNAVASIIVDSPPAHVALVCELFEDGEDLVTILEPRELLAAIDRIPDAALLHKDAFTAIASTWTGTEADLVQVVVGITAGPV